MEVRPSRGRAWFGDLRGPQAWHALGVTAWGHAVSLRGSGLGRGWGGITEPRSYLGCHGHVTCPAVPVGALEGRGGDAVPWPHAVPRHVPSPERLLSPSHVLSLEARAVSPDPCSLRHTLSPKHKLSLWTRSAPPPTPRHALSLRSPAAPRAVLRLTAPAVPRCAFPAGSSCPSGFLLPPSVSPPRHTFLQMRAVPPGTRCPSLVVTCPSSL